MTRAYINYPNPHMLLHRNDNCGEVGKNQKVNQRNLTIHSNSLSQYLGEFRHQLKFGSHANENDVWLTLDFEDAQFEEAVARHLLHLLGLRYKPLAKASARCHC